MAEREIEEDMKSVNVQENGESYQNGVVERGPEIPVVEGHESGSVSLRQYLKSIIFMPKSMRILALTNLLCWMAHVCYCLYFTDFVGEAVFHGDPGVSFGL